MLSQARGHFQTEVVLCGPFPDTSLSPEGVQVAVAAKFFMDTTPHLTYHMGRQRVYYHCYYSHSSHNFFRLDDTLF